MTDSKLRALYQRMYEITASKCKKCGSCCDPTQCADTKKFAETTGKEIPPLPESGSYLGEDGCILAPHQRPICTVHHCAINGLGFFRGDRDTTEAYFEVRFQIDDLEWAHYKDELL